MASRYRTLCGCLSFSEAGYNFGFPAIQVKMHYRMNPACKTKARASWIWQQRVPTKGKDEIGDEHDTAYDEPIQGSSLQPL
jgi:hypothetical protein